MTNNINIPYYVPFFLSPSFWLSIGPHTFAVEIAVNYIISFLDLILTIGIFERFLAIANISSSGHQPKNLSGEINLLLCLESLHRPTSAGAEKENASCISPCAVRDDRGGTRCSPGFFCFLSSRRYLRGCSTFMYCKHLRYLSGVFFSFFNTVFFSCVSIDGTLYSFCR